MTLDRDCQGIFAKRRILGNLALQIPVIRSRVNGERATPRCEGSNIALGDPFAVGRARVSMIGQRGKIINPFAALEFFLFVEILVGGKDPIDGDLRLTRCSGTRGRRGRGAGGRPLRRLGTGARDCRG